MLLEDKELNKSIPLQLNRVRGRAFAKRNQKMIQKIVKCFKSSKVITRECESKITLPNKRLGLHFQMSNPIFFPPFLIFEGFLRSCFQFYTILL